MILDDSELEAVTGGAHNDPIVTLGGVSYFSHTVGNQDTLSRLAYRYNTNVNVLKRLNNITDPDLIQAGRTILIPIAR